MTFDLALKTFLEYFEADEDLVYRLSSSEIKTISQAWRSADDLDLIWMATRPGAMNSQENRAYTLFSLNLISQYLSDPRAKNILTKLNAAEKLTKKDMEEWDSWNNERKESSLAATAANTSESVKKQAEFLRKSFGCTVLYNAVFSILKYEIQ